ncbi:MAG TPA: hemolysin family protein [Bacteroidota bacterium]|nr:hemolysin family protein [Bacteroidota bacterium]
MASQLLGNVIFILLVVFSNAFFVAAEFSIVKVRRSQLDQLVSKGKRGAHLAQHIHEHVDAYLSATQLGITLSSLGLGWIGEPLLADMIREPLGLVHLLSESAIQAIAFLLSFGALTFLHIILGELGPKYIAIQNPETTAITVAIPLQFFYKIFRPFIWFLNSSSNVILRSLGVEPVKTPELLHSPEELESMFTEGAKSGMFGKTEQELISKIFEFSNTTAKEIMVPRTDVVAIEDTTSRDRLIRIVTEEGYSRIPVYHDSLDNITGIIYTKDLISMMEHRDLIVLQDILRPPYFVPDAIRISQLMRTMQDRKLAMAIVIDEFGGTQGIITMEDILEEIVGEIHDEYDEVLKDVEQASDGSAVVNARITIRDFNDKFPDAVPDDPEYETLNGFLYKITGRIPELNEEIRYGDLQFMVIKKGQRRIRQVRVRRIAPPIPAAREGL